MQPKLLCSAQARRGCAVVENAHRRTVRRPLARRCRALEAATHKPGAQCAAPRCFCGAQQLCYGQQCWVCGGGAHKNTISVVPRALPKVQRCWISSRRATGSCTHLVRSLVSHAPGFPLHPHYSGRQPICKTELPQCCRRHRDSPILQWPWCACKAAQRWGCTAASSWSCCCRSCGCHCCSVRQPGVVLHVVHVPA